MRYGLWLVLLGATMVGCVRGGSSTSGSALVHPNFPYAVTYDDESAKSVLGSEWQLENYRRKDSLDEKAPPQIERKDGYSKTYNFDFNDDEKADAKQTLPYPDLVFVHNKTNARLEVATVLLDVRVAQKELRVLLNNIVESGSGTYSLLLGFGSVAAGVEKRFATRLLDSQDASLGGQKGLVATIERADVDQLQLNPNARWRRSRLFLMRAPFDYQVPQGYASPGTDAPKYHKYGVLLVVEYTNTPEDFEAQYPEFVRLLNKMHVLNDAMMMSYLGQPLSECNGHEQNATVNLSISPVGGSTVTSVQGIDTVCADRVFVPYTFAATGERRKVTTQFDFSRPQKPDWLTQASYSETRAVAANDPAAKTEPQAPSAAPPVTPEAAPAPQPVEAEPSKPAEASPAPPK